MRKRKPGIYCLKNIVSNKMYIGKSVNTTNRSYEHFYELKNNKHFNSYLQNSYNKHGDKVFIFGVIEECPIELLNEKERYWIKHYNTYYEGYNCAIPNGFNQGKEFTQEDKDKISKSMKKYFSTIPKYKKVANMNYVRSHVDYSKVKKVTKKVYLYDPNTLKIVKTIPSINECASYLDTTRKNLDKKLSRIWNNKGRTYKGYYVIKEGQDIQDLLAIVNKRVWGRPIKCTT